jgi:adenylate cyclase
MATAEQKLDIHESIDELADSAETLPSLADGLAELAKKHLGVDQAWVIPAERPDELPDDEDLAAFPETVQELTAAAREAGEGWEESTLQELRAIALRPRDKLVGVLIIEGELEDQDLADAFIKRADSAVCHELDRDLLKARNRELSTIYEIDHIRDLHLDFDEMINRIERKVLEIIDVELAVIALRGLHEEEDDALRVHSCVRPGASLDDQTFVASHQKAIHDLVERAFDARTPLRTELDGRAAVCVPLILEEEILGGFVVMSEEGGRISHRDERLFAAVCSQADTAIFEDVQRQRIKDVFKRYVSRDVFHEMLRRDEDFLRGRRRPVTCFFSDLRGFTAVSEKLDVDTVVDMLNEHLEAMCEVIFDHGGTVDKFIGDCVMAFFGAPLEQPDHAIRAVRAADEMRRRHNVIEKKWAARGLPGVKVGIGLHTGEVFVGNIGGEQMTSYTIIGDHVNLASRLEGVSGGDDIIISSDVYDEVKDHVEVESRGELTVKGKTVPTEIFNLLRVF